MVAVSPLALIAALVSIAVTLSVRCFNDTLIMEVCALRRDCVIVILEQKIFVYNFADVKLVHQIETISNQKGLCEISQTAVSPVLVCPGLQNVMRELTGNSKYKSTLIRIFSTQDGTLLQEVRRGADRAEIHSVSFSPTAQWLAVSSSKGTVVFSSLKVNLRVPGNSEYIVTFGHEKNTLLILGLDGSFIRCKFDPASSAKR
ncbi:hypothetical protein HAX54_005972 [Datura stramonium]|uniref:Uncharacterized protein n=1 Tax=Datura stramonium TaxID=4076 RepID=A0ABS8RHS5_DATST|nr:hypothetical protein [Datura stramonium]